MSRLALARSLVVALAVSSLAGAARAADTCDLPTPADCLHKGLELLQAGDAASVGWFAKACASKLPDGCAELGFLYMGSPVLAQDDAQAFAFSKSGCDLGSALGCSNSAVLTRDGRGTAKDDAAMRAFAERGCTLKDGDACYLFGATLEQGIGGKADQAKANAALDKACGYEHGEACYLMAMRYADGVRGAKKDVAKAAARYASACKLGQADACNDLGIHIGAGDVGYPKGGHAAALEYFQAGCKLGDQHCCQNAQTITDGQAQADAPASSGTSSLTIVARSGKKVTVQFAGGSALVVGAEGEVSKAVSQAGFNLNLTIGAVRVTKVTASGAELEVVADKSEIVVDGKKVDHWQKGTVVSFEWKVP
ncbi:MAG: tetratricopeptide repeat protein [Myxococcota bacterium]